MPPPFMLNAPASKNLTLPIVLNPPLSGRFVGRIQYVPTRDNRKLKTNNEKARYPAKFPGIPDALIFFSHPFLRIKARKGWIPEKI